MRVLALDLIIATWMLISAFLFTRTPETLAVVAIGALIVAVASVISRDRPGARVPRRRSNENRRE